MVVQSLTLSLRILLGIVAGRLITRITRPERLRNVATGMLFSAILSAADSGRIVREYHMDPLLCVGTDFKHIFKGMHAP